MPTVIDKRKGHWRIILPETDCPYLFYPRSDIACKILENRVIKGNEDTYCYFENCPRKEV